MKKITLLVTIIVCSLSIFAQPQRGQRDFDPAERAKKSVEQLSEKIEINSEESAQLETVFTKQMTEMKAMFESGERPSREEMEAKRESSNKEIKAILGEERFAKYEEMMQERMSKRKNNRRKPQGESRGDWR